MIERVHRTKRNHKGKDKKRPRTIALRLANFKNTHRIKAPSNKTPALRKITNMGVWAVGTLNQLFIRGS